MTLIECVVHQGPVKDGHISLINLLTLRMWHVNHGDADTMHESRAVRRARKSLAQSHRDCGIVVRTRLILDQHIKSELTMINGMTCYVACGSFVILIKVVPRGLDYRC